MTVSEAKEFYVENPADKVYHDPFSDISHKFENGNLIELGSYEVSGSDTTAHFYERYEYDNRPNHYKISAVKYAIPGDFHWAKARSKNNLVHAMYLGPAGGWDKTYDFQYDNNNNLKRYTGPTGITVDFEYDCK